MKLALARVMLFEANILLLDELTNHLVVVNVAYLENYLTLLETCTSSTYCNLTWKIFLTIFFSVIFSHDSGFLDSTITDVLHLNRFKLKRTRQPRGLHEGCS